MSDATGASTGPRWGVDGGSLDASTFAELVRPHMIAMTRLAARLGPNGGQDDVVQDALVRVHSRNPAHGLPGYHRAFLCCPLHPVRACRRVRGPGSGAYGGAAACGLRGRAAALASAFSLHSHVTHRTCVVEHVQGGVVLGDQVGHRLAHPIGLVGDNFRVDHTVQPPLVVL